MQAHKVILWICLMLVAAIRSAEAKPILEAIGDGIGSIFEGIGEGIGDAFEGIGDFVGSLTEGRGRGPTPSVPLGAGVPLPPPTGQVIPTFSEFQQSLGNIGGPQPAFPGQSFGNIGGGPSPSFSGVPQDLGVGGIGSAGSPLSFQPPGLNNIAGPQPTF